MTSYICQTTVDCQNAYALATWWSQVLDMTEDPQDPNEPGDEECGISSPDGRVGLLFLEVPEPKRTKNRLHLDLRPVDGTRDDEIERVRGLGARLIDDRRTATGGWVVLSDPEGNEFCILRSLAELEL